MKKIGGFWKLTHASIYNNITSFTIIGYMEIGNNFRTLIFPAFIFLALVFLIGCSAQSSQKLSLINSENLLQDDTSTVDSGEFNEETGANSIANAGNLNLQENEIREGNTEEESGIGGFVTPYDPRCAEFPRQPILGWVVAPNSSPTL